MAPAGTLPSHIGPYEILSELGAGGMGMVYRARHRQTGDEVALKTVLASRTIQLSGLRREIHALIDVRHPGVVRFVDEGLHDGRPWYAMELLQGRTLAALMTSAFQITPSSADAELTTAPALPRPVAEHGTTSRDVVKRGGDPRRAGAASGPSWPQTLELLGVIESLCAPLAFIHTKGIVHRDLTPANILIRQDGTPVLMDFGLASRFASGLSRERVDLVGDLRGTPAYMAPELLRGTGVVDARADLYSIGCILYEIATGQRLFAGGSVQEYVRGHLHRQPLPPSELAAVPRPLEELILRLLAKPPRDRIGHADDIAAALAEIRGVSRPDTAVAHRGYLYRPQLVGRERLSQQLEEYLAAAAGGHGRSVLIGGESGVGKTSLASALTAGALEQGFLVVSGGCEPTVMPDGSVGGAAPLHPFRPLLQAIADYCVDRGETATRRIFGPGNGALVLAAYEPRLAELPGVDRTAAPGDLPPEGALERLFSLLAESLSQLAASQPLLLIVDDLHWADDLSLRFLRSLTESYYADRHLLVIGTYRSDDVSPALRLLLDAPGIGTMQVGRLSDSAIDAMVADMLALPAAPPALLEFVLRHSDGNPFFVAEYLRAAVAEGLVIRQAGRWQAMEDGSGVDAARRIPALPSSLRDLVSRRLDGLEATTRAVVEAAATLGRDFAAELLHAMVDAGEHETFKALGDLLERQVLDQAGGGRLAFAHHQIRDVAYERIETGRRRALHRAAATTIERTHQADADYALLFVGLARHWEGANEIPKAVEYLDKAADYALRTSAYTDTVRLFGKAGELTAGQPSRDGVREAHRQLAMGEAWLGLDDYANSRLHLGRAVSGLGYPVPEPKGRLPGLVVELVRQTARRLGRRRAAPPVSRAVDEATRAYAHLQIAWRYTENPALVLVYLAIRSLNLAERGASPEARTMAYAQAVVLAATIPLHAAARRYEELAQAALAETADRNAHSFFPIASAVYHAGIADWDHAAAAAARSADIALEVGFRRRREDAMAIGGFIEITRWRPGDIARLYGALEESARRGAQRPRIWALGGLAMLALRLGTLREAEARMRQLDAIKAADLDPADCLQLYAATGLVSAHLDDPGARKALDRALAVLEKTPPMLIEAIDPCARLAEAYIRLWQKAKASGHGEANELARSAERVCAFARRLSKRFPIMAPDALHWRAEADFLLGRRAPAIRGWEVSLAAAERCHMAYHAWRAHQTLAEHHDDTGRAASHRAKADALQPAVFDSRRTADVS
jgi:hypothetical protein